MSNFTEITRTGFGKRNKNAVGGAVFGLVLVAAAIFLLFWNEGRAVDRYRDLKEGAGAVEEIPSDTVAAENEGKLVHITGEAKTSGPLADPEFGISENAIKLIRSAEMYQWVERSETEKNKEGGGSVTTKKTYSYETEWRDGLVDSSNFKVAADHQNPTEMKYRSSTMLAESVTVGAFDLPEFLVKKIGGAENLQIASLENADASVRADGKISDGGVYFGADPANPSVGDIRVNFSVVRPGPVSVVAQQQSNSFVPYKAKSGGEVDLLERGTVPAADMFQLAHDRNKMLTWGLRVLGFILLSTGFSLILAPLAVFADIVPFLGKIVGAGTKLVGLLLAGIVWTIVVAIAWIFHRPVLGVAILAVTVALIVLAVKKIRKADQPPPLNA